MSLIIPAESSYYLKADWKPSGFLFRLLLFFYPSDRDGSSEDEKMVCHRICKIQNQLDIIGMTLLKFQT